jgi:isoprenylcysteine carboxyl methyltransferase (ICMT) family protein YpbQ
LPPYWVIGIGAGLVGAFLFLSASLGSPLLGIPIYFAALPVFLAGLGWGMRAAFIAAMTGFVVLSSLSSFTAGVVFLVADGLAPAWLVRLALLHHIETEPRLTPADAARLARKDGGTYPPEGPDASPAVETTADVEWYPPGALTVWTAFIGASVLIVSGISTMLMGVEGGLEGALRMLLTEELLEGGAIKAMLRDMGLNADPERILSIIVIALPAVVVFFWSLLTLGNMWLAQFILVRTGNNLRPTPDFTQIELPNFLLGLFAGALLLSLVPGPAAQLGGAIMIALLVPYFLLGLAVIHAISRAWTARIAILGVFYILLIFAGWLVIPISLIGLLEPWVDLRARFASAEAPTGEEIE